MEWVKDKLMFFTMKKAAEDEPCWITMDIHLHWIDNVAIKSIGNALRDVHRQSIANLELLPLASILNALLLRIIIHNHDFNLFNSNNMNIVLWRTEKKKNEIAEKLKNKNQICKTIKTKTRSHFKVSSKVVFCFNFNIISDQQFYF